ncbi:copper resistance CopC family protein [Micromonospora sp. ATCC 39149]|uniref:Copper resistance protein CopC n=1 Tax=Micromonospora carbonacea TaxID=47853 RepID=A0A7D6CFK4_9ACTN|nr:copper resistance CopC family protein [Micromonospora sp. ATCC 39149]QLJ97391.1 copper resistance protein CopC [Micromonospora carbonacea]
MGGRFPRMVRGWIAVLGVSLGVSLALPASPAAAHNSLSGSNPANGARVAKAPDRIELRFLAKPNPGTTKITVTGPDNVVALGGEPTFSGTRVRIPFAPGAAGLYIVGYQVTSADGHPIKGELRFTLTTGTPAQPPSPSATASEPPSPSGAPPSSVGAATHGPASATPVADESTRKGPPGWLWALGGGLLLLLAAVAAVFAVRRRRS